MLPPRSHQEAVQCCDCFASTFLGCLDGQPVLPIALRGVLWRGNWAWIDLRDQPFDSLHRCDSSCSPENPVRRHYEGENQTNTFINQILPLRIGFRISWNIGEESRTFSSSLCRSGFYSLVAVLMWSQGQGAISWSLTYTLCIRREQWRNKRRTDKVQRKLSKSIFALSWICQDTAIQLQDP